MTRRETLPILLALLLVCCPWAAGLAHARTCGLSSLPSFVDKAQWPFYRILVVRVLKHHYQPSDELRLSYWFDAELLEDVNGIELRPRVRIASHVALDVRNVGSGGGYGFPEGTILALALRRMSTTLLTQHADKWEEVTLIDYYLYLCEEDVIELNTLDEATAGPVAAARSAWQARLRRAAERRRR